MAFQAEGSVSRSIKLIEGLLRDLGHQPDKMVVSGAQGGRAWAIKFGSAAVMIAVNPGVSSKSGRLRMVSAIVRFDEGLTASVMAKLLEWNVSELPGVAFGIAGNEVVLVAERNLRGLDREEVEDMLALIGHLADKYDDELVEKFGGVRVCDIA